MEVVKNIIHFRRIYMNYIEALQKRRSIYAIGNQPMISDDQLQKMITAVVEATPSAYNSQSQRVVLLLGKKHQELWDLVLEALKKIIPAKQVAKTTAKIASFAAGYGTILFFDEQKITQGLMDEYPLYKDNFAVWYQQHAGMLQENLWVALATEGYGASLQHYNELIESQVKTVFQLPDTWKLLAQMPFGAVLSPAEAKEKDPISERFLIRK
jgi:hypothetical protein